MPLSDDLIRELKHSVEVQHLHGSRSPTSLEWWYLTGHLWKVSSDSSCETLDDVLAYKKKRAPELAIQATFFLSDKNSQKGFLAHAAQVDLSEKKHSSSEVYSRLSQTGGYSPIASAEKFYLNNRLGHWRLSQLGATERALKWDLRFDVKGSEFILQLDVPKNGLWFHGRNGYLQKTPDTGNFYYSVPFVLVRGVRVQSVSEQLCGQLWFDHEIHVENVLDVGWKWFGLSFSNKKALMFYQISSHKSDYQPAGELWDQSTAQSIALKDVQIDPKNTKCLTSGRCYPQAFSISFTNPLTKRRERVETQAAFPEQEMANQGPTSSRVYWEGSTSARWFAAPLKPNQQEQPVDGLGFTELVPQIETSKSLQAPVKPVP